MKDFQGLHEMQMRLKITNNKTIKIANQNKTLWKV